MPELAEQPITLYRGSSHRLRFTMDANGDISDYVVKWSLRKKETDPDPLLLDLDGAIVTVGSVSTPGVIEVIVTRANTLTLPKGTYEFGLNRVDAGLEDVLAKGPATVALNVRDPKA